MISVVCPFYNEKENLGELYERLTQTLKPLDESWEIIFVDDGSADGGAESLAALAGKSTSIHLIRLDRNYGLSTALYAGLERAKGELLVTLDSDLQNPPEEIPKLLSELPGYDIVTGVRQRRQDSRIKILSSKIANGIRRAVTGDHMLDVGCTLRVFRREALQAFAPFKGMHRFFLTLAEAQGCKIKQVPVKHEPRRRGKAKYHLANRLAGPLWDLYAVHWMLAHRIHYEMRTGDHV